MMKRIALVAVIGLLAAAGYWLWQRDHADSLPPGFARSNGRIEAERVDVATKFGGRLKEILVNEGDMVEAGQVLARLDTAQIEAQLREAEAGVRAAEQGLAEARAVLAELVERDIFVRMPFVAPQDRCIRVSTGPDDQIDAFATELPAALQAARQKLG